jgi:hypothetical protein
LGVNPVNLLVNVPLFGLSEEMLSAIVGDLFVLQQTPLATIEEPPLEVIVPPTVAVVCAILLTTDVVKTGRVTSSFLQLSMVKNDVANNVNRHIPKMHFFIGN